MKMIRMRMWIGVDLGCACTVLEVKKGNAFEARGKAWRVL